MLRHPLSRVAVLAVALASSVVAAPTPSPPKKITGHISYRENGPIAFGAGGLAVSMLMAPQAGGIAIGRMQGLFKALMNNPKLAGEKPGSKSVNMAAFNTFPQGTVLGLSTHYSADVEFELEVSDQDPSAFVLKKGTVRWRGLNTNKFSAGGHTLLDQFSDSGSAPLDVAKSSVRVTYDKDHAYTLEANISHPMKIRGQSSWSVVHEGTTIFQFNYRYGAVMEMSGVAVGQPIPPETSPNPDIERGFVLVTHGDLDSPAATETWRDLVDNQVVAEHRLGTNCLLELTNPDPKQPNRKWIADDDGAGKAVVKGELVAKVVPSGLADDVTWELPELPGMTLETEPSSKKGAKVSFKYTGDLAADAFGKERYRVAAKLEKPVEGCTDQDTKVGLYFKRSAWGNRSEAELGQKRPNYHYYWFKTPAGQGKNERNTEYGGQLCVPGYLGYHPPGTNLVHVCDMQPENFTFTNIFTSRTVTGIDMFGEEVLHEWRHREHELEWTGQPDSDRDGVPDAVEDAWASKGFKNDDRYSAVKWATGSATYDSYFNDEEVITFREMDAWAVGSANQQDWACPGKQCREGE
jgi:hypothetical protein